MGSSPASGKATGSCFKDSGADLSCFTTGTVLMDSVSKSVGEL